MISINQYFKEKKSKVKIKVIWTPEMAQDISAFHNIDAEAELIRILSEEIAAEIDMRIIRNMRLNYGTISVN
jgi:succinyl-CoA synthetase alpha subunit